MENIIMIFFLKAKHHYDLADSTLKVQKGNETSDWSRAEQDEIAFKYSYWVDLLSIQNNCVL